LKHYALLLGLMAGLAAWPLAGGAQPVSKSRFSQGPTNPFVIGVAGEGRVMPAGGLLRLSVPAAAQGAAQVGLLLVKAGDWVDTGQLLAVMSTRPILQAQAAAAQAQAAAAQAALDQAKAAAAQADTESAGQLSILNSRAQAAEATAHLAAVNSALALEQAKADAAAAQAAVDAAKVSQTLLLAVGNATLAVAQAQYEDIPRLSGDARKVGMAGIEQTKATNAKASVDMAIQIAQLQAQADAAALKVKQAEANLVVEPEEPVDGAPPSEPVILAPVQLEAQEARANFKAEETARDQELAARTADVAAAQARLTAAQADAAAAQAQVALSEIHAPYAGRILGVHARPGELVGAEGVFDFGDTRDMYVDVEVAYDDVTGVHIGQKAVISCDALSDNYTGEAVEIGGMVGTNQLQNVDTALFTDNRVVMVKVHLDKPEVFANLVNGQVTVRFEP
jgi:HlyD family secretion protein